MTKPKRKTHGKMPEAIQRPDLSNVEPTPLFWKAKLQTEQQGREVTDPAPAKIRPYDGLAFASPMW